MPDLLHNFGGIIPNLCLFISFSRTRFKTILLISGKNLMEGCYDSVKVMYQYGKFFWQKFADLDLDSAAC